MNIPAPAPLARIPAITVAAPFGWIAPEQLAVAQSAGRAPVILHRLGGENARLQRGPREFRDEAVAALEAAAWKAPWGLGGVCRSAEDAAQFATAGFTWFTLDLTDHLDARASSMSLDELDAAIVALEDRGAFRPGWHESYLDHGQVAEIAFTDETLARAAARYGAALQVAEEMVQAIRVCSSERGDPPDLEIVLGNALFPTSPADLAFVAAEASPRGFIHGGVTRFAPSFGTHYEPGAESPQELPSTFDRLLAIASPTALISVPEPLGRAAGSPDLQWNAEHAGQLAWLRRLAATNPVLFRQWLLTARDVFPAAQTGWHLSTSEDDVRFLPEVADNALVPTFLETTQGRQLLLATWQDVADQMAPVVAANP